eukprot:Tamp_05595.p1 GENE.Tamp_05595~~Tamp_05595.p1  ORF type:complete len:460 (-),score=79.67 Tamp_05595:1028-2407(-)
MSELPELRVRTPMSPGGGVGGANDADWQLYAEFQDVGRMIMLKIYCEGLKIQGSCTADAWTADAEYWDISRLMRKFHENKIFDCLNHKDRGKRTKLLIQMVVEARNDTAHQNEEYKRDFRVQDHQWDHLLTTLISLVQHDWIDTESRRKFEDRLEGIKQKKQKLYPSPPSQDPEWLNHLSDVFDNKHVDSWEKLLAEFDIKNAEEYRRKLSVELFEDIICKYESQLPEDDRELGYKKHLAEPKLQKLYYKSFWDKKVSRSDDNIHYYQHCKRPEQTRTCSCKKAVYDCWQDKVNPKFKVVDTECFKKQLKQHAEEDAKATGEGEGTLLSPVLPPPAPSNDSSNIKDGSTKVKKRYNKNQRDKLKIRLETPPQDPDELYELYKQIAKEISGLPGSRGVQGRDVTADDVKKWHSKAKRSERHTLSRGQSETAQESPSASAARQGDVAVAGAAGSANADAEN